MTYPGVNKKVSEKRSIIPEQVEKERKESNF